MVLLFIQSEPALLGFVHFWLDPKTNQKDQDCVKNG